jgi:lysozyme
MVDELQKQIEFEEGRRLRKYKCTAGHWTIGIGHNLDAKPFHKGQKIPDVIDNELCDDLFEEDLGRTINSLDAMWDGFRMLSGTRQDACINMAFQLGVDGFMRFRKLREALMLGDWSRAEQEALNSKWAKNDTPARAKRVAEQLRTGQHYEIPDK